MRHGGYTLISVVVIALLSCHSEASLSCVVQQAAPPLVPTAQVLPGGNVLFNDLQYAINQCPFATVAVDAPAVCGDGEDVTRIVNASGCISIANRIEPIRITGLQTGRCRSVLLFNASWCARGAAAVISVDNAMSVTLSDLTVAWAYAPNALHNVTFLSSVNVISVILHRIVANLTVTGEWSSETSSPSSSGGSASNRDSNSHAYSLQQQPFALWRFQLTQNVTVAECALQLLPQRTCERPISNVRSVEEVDPSVVICVRIATRALLWFDEVPFAHVEISQLSAIVQGGKIIRASNATIFVDGIVAEVGSASASSYGARDVNVDDSDTVSKTFRAAQSTPPAVAVCNPTPNEPFLFLDQFSGSRFVNSVVHLHCGTACAVVVVPAVVAFRSASDAPTELELAEGLILRNVTLNLVDASLPLPSVTVPTDAFGVVNFIAIRSLAANCILVDGVVFQNAPSLSCTAILLTAPNVYNSLISHPTMMVAIRGSSDYSSNSNSNSNSNGGVAPSFAAVPMSQSFRSASQPTPTGLQLWLEAAPCPLESLFDDLEATYAPITNCTITPLVASGGPEASAFYQCCTVQSTVFYSAVAAIVTILLGLATLRAASHRSGAAASTKTTAFGGGPLADSTASTLGCCGGDRYSGAAAESRKATAAFSETEEPLLSAPRRSTASEEPPNNEAPGALPNSKAMLGGGGAASSQNAFLHPGGGKAISIPRMTSGTASDMILYLPGGDGWSAHSVHGGWQWSPNNHAVISHGNSSVVVSRAGSADRPHPITFVSSISAGHTSHLSAESYEGTAAAVPSQPPALQSPEVAQQRTALPSNDSRPQLPQQPQPHEHTPALGSIDPVQAVKQPSVVLVSGTADAIPFPVASRVVASRGSVHSSEYSDSTPEATDNDEDAVN